MKTLVIYDSYYRNHTEKIAQVFKKKINCDLIHVKDMKHKDISIKEYDLIGFGSGVYAETMSPKLFLLLDNLNLESKNVFVFSTSGVGMKFYNNNLVKDLKSKGAIVRGSFACIGSFNPRDFTDTKIFDLFAKISKCHPNNKDFKKAEKFIDKVIDFLI